MRAELLQDALKKIETPEYLVNVISRRVRQLGMGYRPLIPVSPKMTFMDVALKEVAEGKLSYELTPAVDAEEEGPKKSRKKS